MEGRKEGEKGKKRGADWCQIHTLLRCAALTWVVRSYTPYKPLIREWHPCGGQSRNDLAAWKTLLGKYNPGHFQSELSGSRRLPCLWPAPPHCLGSHTEQKVKRGKLHRNRQCLSLLPGHHDGDCSPLPWGTDTRSQKPSLPPFLLLSSIGS